MDDKGHHGNGYGTLTLQELVLHNLYVGEGRSSRIAACGRLEKIRKGEKPLLRINGVLLSCQAFTGSPASFRIKMTQGSARKVLISAVGEGRSVPGDKVT